VLNSSLSGLVVQLQVLEEALETLLQTLEVPVLIDASVDHRTVEDALALLGQQVDVVVQFEELLGVCEVVVHVLGNYLLRQRGNQPSEVRVLRQVQVLSRENDVHLYSVKQQSQD